MNVLDCGGVIFWVDMVFMYRIDGLRRQEVPAEVGTAKVFSHHLEIPKNWVDFSPIWKW